MKTLQITGFIFLLGITGTTYAQKIADVQNVSLLAPENIKADGKDLEWNNSFMANNKRTDIFYTMSNDDKNLYLTVRAADVTAIAKILAGGITLSINTEGKKKEEESISLTYPVINRAAGNNAQSAGRRVAVQGVRGSGGAQTITVSSSSGDVSAKQRDSIRTAGQKAQLARVKEISIRGFKNISDTLISIYNEYGIKAFSSIDKDNAFFYELAMPLSSLGLSTDAPGEFAYNIKLNGQQQAAMSVTISGTAIFSVVSVQRSPGSGQVDYQALTSPTDFWGKYTLAKKQ